MQSLVLGLKAEPCDQVRRDGDDFFPCRIKEWQAHCVTNREAGGRARRELRLVQIKPITARAPQAASAGVPLVLIQDARARKVNGDVIVRRRPRRTDECGFDPRRGMRARSLTLNRVRWHLGSILDADMGSSAAPIQKEQFGFARR